MSNTLKKIKQSAQEYNRRSTYQDSMTLDDIGEYDLYMHHEAIKDANIHRFDGISKSAAAKAQKFIGHCVNATMDRLGVKITQGMPAKMIDRIMEVNGVKVEHRDKYRAEENVWRNGIYIYKDDVLVAFISNIVGYTPHELEVRQKDCLVVITNAKV